MEKYKNIIIQLISNKENQFLDIYKKLKRVESNITKKDLGEYLRLLEKENEILFAREIYFVKKDLPVLKNQKLLYHPSGYFYIENVINNQEQETSSLSLDLTKVTKELVTVSRMRNSKLLPETLVNGVIIKIEDKKELVVSEIVSYNPFEVIVEINEKTLYRMSNNLLQESKLSKEIMSTELIDINNIEFINKIKNLITNDNTVLEKVDPMQETIKVGKILDRVLCDFDVIVSPNLKLGDVYKGVINPNNLLDNPTLNLTFLEKDYIGNKDDFDIDSNIALKKYNLQLENTLSLDNFKNKESIKSDKRKNLKNLPFVTIDGEHTKDIDDGVYAEKTHNGKIKLFVAIADVSSFIEKSSLLDDLANERATSIYMPHKTIHMLPYELSAEKCSLNPNEEKEVLICEIILNKSYLVESSHFYEAMIISKERLTYKKVDQYLSTQSITNLNLQSNIIDFKIENSLNLLNKIATNVKENGKSLFENKVQYDFTLNELGKIDKIKAVNEMTPAYKLIEKAMLLANKEAAKLLFNHNILHGFFRNQLIPITEPKLTPEEDLIELQKNIKPAFYGEVNFGHFGLGTDYYTHFTSPIRRFSDLIVHRLIKDIINKKSLSYSIDELKEIASHINNVNKNSKFAYNKVKNRLTYDYALRNIGKQESVNIEEIKDVGIVCRGNETLLEYFLPYSRYPEIENNTVKDLVVKITSVDIYNEKIFTDLTYSLDIVKRNQL